jgi:hypothetical protein
MCAQTQLKSKADRAVDAIRRVASLRFLVNMERGVTRRRQVAISSDGCTSRRHKHPYRAVRKGREKRRLGVALGNLVLQDAGISLLVTSSEVQGKGRRVKTRVLQLT